jgi:uncharacterized protein (TIGR02246 family)
MSDERGIFPRQVSEIVMTVEDARILVERQARAWERADLDAIVADFAPNGVFISPSGRWEGKDAVRQAAIDFFATARDVKIYVSRVILMNNFGAAEWTWSETRIATGKRHTADDAIIFTVRDGKIFYWREYFDTAQLG